MESVLSPWKLNNHIGCRCFVFLFLSSEGLEYLEPGCELLKTKHNLCGKNAAPYSGICFLTGPILGLLEKESQRKPGQFCIRRAQVDTGQTESFLF